MTTPQSFEQWYKAERDWLETTEQFSITNPVTFQPSTDLFVPIKDAKNITQLGHSVIIRKHVPRNREGITVTPRSFGLKTMEMVSNGYTDAWHKPCTVVLKGFNDIHLDGYLCTLTNKDTYLYGLFLTDVTHKELNTDNEWIKVHKLSDDAKSKLVFVVNNILFTNPGYKTLLPFVKNELIPYFTENNITVLICSNYMIRKRMHAYDVPDNKLDAKQEHELLQLLTACNSNKQNTNEEQPTD